MDDHLALCDGGGCVVGRTITEFALGSLSALPTLTHQNL